MSTSLRLVGVVGLITASLTAAFSGSASAASEGFIRGADSANAVTNSYIVVLKDTASLRSRGSAATASEMGRSHRGSVKFVYSSALRGFATTMSEADARRLATDSRVDYVQQNQTVHKSGSQNNPPSWGLDRLDQRDLPLNYSYNTAGNGSGVRAYILDTGIRLSHSDFGGRAVSGFDAIDGGSADDCDGHGTHVAGTVGGTQYGVAKGVTLVAVRVLNCQGSGSTAQVIAGIDWVKANAIKPAVANMSLGGAADSAMDAAVRSAIASGVQFSTAAGNGNDQGVAQNACDESPGRVLEGMTVGATSITDAKVSWSNFGTCLDLFAPGFDITSSTMTTATSSETWSGTSMAAPHVAGAAALYLSGNASATPQQVRDYLVNNATSGKVTSAGTGSPDKLLFVAGGVPGNLVTVNNPGNQTGTVGTPKSVQLTGSSSGGGALTYTATGLPPGTTISSGGLLSGTPTTTGTYSTKVTGRDSTGANGFASFTFTVSGAGACASGQKLANSGFESGATSWSTTPGVIGNSTGQPARTGVWRAWLNGYGTTTTDTLSQSVAIPAGCASYTFSFWLRITTDERTRKVAYDKLTVKVGATTLATYSNLNKNSTYTQKSFNLSGFAGQTVTVNFTGVENSSLQTAFVIDDTALTAS